MKIKIEVNNAMHEIRLLLMRTPVVSGDESRKNELRELIASTRPLCEVSGIDCEIFDDIEGALVVN